MIAIYPGSFDPPTVGHLEIMQRASRLFEHLHVVVLINPQKHPTFCAEDRVQMIRDCVVDLPNVSACASEGTIIEAVQQLGADVILRGLRSEADYLSEKSVTDAILKLWGTETLFMQCEPELGYVSSSLVRELMLFGAPIDKLVPTPILSRVMSERSMQHGS